MDISKYELFAKTAELNNLSAAADYLGYTQSAASHIISVLESELGVTLFTRSRHGMELTSNGKALLPHVYSLLQDENRIRELALSIQGIESGQITVTSISHITIHWLSFIVSEFIELHPGINVDLLDGSYAQINRWVASGRVDVGICIKTHVPDMKFELLASDTLFAVINEKNPLSKKTIISLEDFENEVFIVPSQGTQQDIINLIGNIHIRPKPYINAVGDATALALVRQNLGITLLPGILLSSSELNHLAIRRIDGCKTHSIGIASNPHFELSPAAALFVDFTKKWVSHHLENDAHMYPN